MTILAGNLWRSDFFSDPVRVLSIGRNPIQVLLIRSDPVRVLSIRSGPGFVNTHALSQNLKNPMDFHCGQDFHHDLSIHLKGETADNQDRLLSRTVQIVVR